MVISKIVFIKNFNSTSNKYALHESINQLGKYFKEFKNEWNHKKLDSEYYNGFSDFVLIKSIL